MSISNNVGAESWMIIQKNTFANLSGDFEKLSIKLDEQSIRIQNQIKNFPITSYRNKTRKEAARAKLKSKIENFRSTVTQMKNLLKTTTARTVAIYNRMLKDTGAREFLGETFDDVLDRFEELEDAVSAEVEAIQNLPDHFAAQASSI